MRGDIGIHRRLGERGLVTLVMAVPAVADDIDKNVPVKLLAEIQRQPSAQKRTASGSSPFTWKTGASIIFATSVQ